MTARSWRVTCLLLLTGGLVAWFAQARLAEGRARPRNVGTSIEQCRNGAQTVVDCSGSAWTTGDLNAQNSSYREGDFVPFRTIITGLTADTVYTLRIGYDAVERGLHAYDYLGSFDASNAPGQQVVPCDGVAGTSGPHSCGIGSQPGNPSTFPVPTDVDTHFPSGSQQPGVFSAWGGLLQGAAYVSPTPITVATTGTVEREIDVTFKADGNTVVLAWGGHVASNLDWGAGETFVGSAPGASFHMRLKLINGASTGNQDLSMHGDVIAPTPAPFSTQAQPSVAVISDPVTDTASLTGTSGPPLGFVAFFICFDATTRPDCRAGGEPVARTSALVSRFVRRRPRTSATVVASTTFIPRDPGFYCFRAEYTPAAGVPYSPGSHTDTTSECFQAATPTTLSVTKICDPTSDAGHFNLLIDGAVVLANVPCGAGTGPITVPPGPHTVSETAAAGTSLGDYATTIGADCAANGTITLAPGQSRSCTITNVRQQPPSPQTATLKVNKVCQPASDEGLFDLYIDSYRFPNVACGHAGGPITLPIGQYTVSEQAGVNTSLDDYTAVISGDCAANGVITLTAGQTATCTITNTRKPASATTITVEKNCVPADDSGRFNLMIDGRTAGNGANVGCGGSTGAVTVQPGLHTITETGAGGTDLGKYTTTIGGDCASDGSIPVAQGDEATCTITNVRKGQSVAFLTVTKICIPQSDGGLFNLYIGQQVAPDEPCGGSLGPLAVSVGAHRVGETAGTGTNLADYTTTLGGACAADGSITLAAGQSAVCTITNSLNPPPPTATINITKGCVPATTKGRFTLQLDGQLLPGWRAGRAPAPSRSRPGLTWSANFSQVPMPRRMKP
jgi:hypothetical protein